MIIPESNPVDNLYITGGFSKNLFFLKLIASSFPDKRLMVSEISNATALGAASVLLSSLYPEKKIIPRLGLDEMNL
jgi:sugar (pentulose or hexulose) kinase